MKNLKNNKHTQGFSLIELMIAVLIGVIMLTAIVSLFSNFSLMNRAQNGMARIQENGRYITLRMKQDIENVGFQPCASVSMNTPLKINKGFSTRPLISFSSLSNGLPNAVSGEKASVIDTQYFIQGHECDGSACSPETDIDPGGNPYGNIPDTGVTAGDKAPGTDVLTVRYINAKAATINDDTLLGGFVSSHSTVNLNSDPSLAPLKLEDGNDILISNCINSLIVGADIASGNKITTLNYNGGLQPEASVLWASRESLTHIYNFTKNFVTVSYFVGLKANPVNSNFLISTLYRVENDGDPQEIIEGVERFDLTYGVLLSDGKIGYMDADEIQSNADFSKCVVEPVVPGSLTGLTLPVNGTGCLWRSVFAIKVNVLLNTVYNSSLSNSETFTYSLDATNPQTPANNVNGVNGGNMHRKEFTETISLQSYNL